MQAIAARTVELRIPDIEIGQILAALDAESVCVQQSRRRSPRFSLRGMRITVEVMRPNCAVTRIIGRARNVSRYGAAILTNVLIQPDTDVRVFLPIRPNNEPVVKNAVVVRCRYLRGSVFEVGVEFGRKTAGEANEGSAITDDSVADTVATMQPVMNRAYTIERIRKELQLRGIGPVIQYILSLTSSSKTGLDEVVDAVKKDASLSASVLRAATSAMYESGKPARSVGEAVQRLGMEGVRGCASQVLMSQQFANADSAGLVPRRNWEHALATAIIAQELAGQVKGVDASVCYLAGLLHGIGRMALASLFSEEYRQVLVDVDRRGVEPCVVEREMFGLSSGEATRVVLEEMKVMNEVVSAAAMLNESPEAIKRRETEPGSCLIVATATRLARAAGLGGDKLDTLVPLSPFFAAIGVPDESIHEILLRAKSTFADWSVFFAMRVADGTLDSRLDELRSLSPHSAPHIRWIGRSTSNAPAIFLDALDWVSSDEINAFGGAAANVADIKAIEQALGKVNPQQAGLPLILFLTSGKKVTLQAEIAGHPVTRIEIPKSHEAIVRAISEAVAKFENARSADAPGQDTVVN